MTVPWFIGSNGALHSPEVARSLAYAATGGGEGVVSPLDMRVVALGVPGASVGILPGGAVMLNRSPGASYQSYVDRVLATEFLAIGATGGVARHDLIVRRVQDPDYPGWNVPADPVNGPYATYAVITGVSANCTTAKELNLNYPAIALARIDIPPLTGAIQQGHIVDLRKMANRRSERRVFMGQPGAQDLVSAVSVNFPNTFVPTVDIPQWATHYSLIAHLAGVNRVTGPAIGYLWALLGEANAGHAAPVGYDVNGATDSDRDTYLIANTGSLLGYEGTTQTLRVIGRRDLGPGALRFANYSTVVFDIEFFESV